MLIVVYNEIASWPTWSVLIIFLVWYIAIYRTSFRDFHTPRGPRAYRFSDVPLPTRHNWIAWLVGIIAGFCVFEKFCIGLGIWFGWLPEKL
jgi:hypothetical protein